MIAIIDTNTKNKFNYITATTGLEEVGCATQLRSVEWVDSSEFATYHRLMNTDFVYYGNCNFIRKVAEYYNYEYTPLGELLYIKVKS